MIPIKTIEDLIDKHASLEKELSSGSVEKKSSLEHCTGARHVLQWVLYLGFYPLT